MAQIGFTAKTENIYNRFNKMRLAYAEEHGRTYAPSFLTVLMDAFEKLDRIKVIPFSPDMELSEFVKTVVRSAVDNIADAEAKEQVIIKQIDGSQYLEKMLAHNHNAYLTPQRDKAMVFDNRDQATAFLRQCGHEIGNWIIEPV